MEKDAAGCRVLNRKYIVIERYTAEKADIIEGFDKNKGIYGYRRITEELKKKGCSINHKMKNYFDRLKVEMFYGEQFESVKGFIHASGDYIHYYNNERISLKLKGMSPVQYRTHSQAN